MTEYDEVEGVAQEELYDTQQIADMFRVSHKTVVRWDELGRFEERGVHVLRTAGGHRRYRKDEIHQLFQKMLEGGL